MMAVNAWRNELDELAKRIKLRRRVAVAMVLIGAAAVIGVLYSIFGPAMLILAGGVICILFGLSVLSE